MAASSSAWPGSASTTSTFGSIRHSDFHSTILHLLGIDHTRLTYRHAGRDFRLTDVHGTVTIFT